MSVLDSAVFEDRQTRRSQRLYINDTVGLGQMLEADGDITIVGSVHDAIVISRYGSIMVEGTVKGHSNTMLKAGGNVCARYARDAVLEAQGTVALLQGMANCVVVADNIQVSQRAGGVVGGTLTAWSKIDVWDVGSPGSVFTRLCIVDPESDKKRCELRELERLEERIACQAETPRRRLAQVNKAMRRTGVVGAAANQEFRIALQEYLAVSTKLQYVRDQRQALARDMDRPPASPGSIVIRGTVFAGVQLCLYDAHTFLSSTQTARTYTYADHKINSGPCDRQAKGAP